MSRTGQAHILLNRLRNVGMEGILREALDLPFALSQPVSRLSAVLRIPPVLLWAALTALLGSAILAVSWILTALILALTRPHDGSDVAEGAGGLKQTGGGDSDDRGVTVQRSPVPLPGRAAAGLESEGHPSPVTSWPLGDEEDSDDDTGVGGIISAIGHEGARAGAPRDMAKRSDAAETPSAAAVAAAQAWSRPPWVALSMPYLDEQQAAEVRRHVSRYASVIPATAFEAARSCGPVFGLQLDVAGYCRLFQLPSEGEGGLVRIPEEGEEGGEGDEGEEEAAGQEKGDGGRNAAGGSASALGRLALRAHLARYLYGVCGAPSCAIGTAANMPPPSSPPKTGSQEPLHQRVSETSATATAAETAAEAALYGIADFVRPEVLAGLARRLRLDMLIVGPPPGHLHSGSATAAASAGDAGTRSSSSSNAKVRALRRAAAADPAAAAGRRAPPPAALADALLRLVWEAHVADVGRAWLAVCVLVGLARELRLVGNAKRL